MDTDTAKIQTRRRLIPGWVGNLALLTVSVAVALLLGEFATRWLRPQQLRHLGPIYRPRDTIGFERLPNLRTRANLGDRWVDVNTDHEGYRVGTEGRVEADTRVLLLGDSFVEALGVPYEESYAGLLQSSLPASVGRPVAVRNGGVSGYSPTHYFLAGERAFAREHFDLVVVSIFVGNDLITRPTLYHKPFYRAREPQPRVPSHWSLKEINRVVVMPLMLRLVARSHLAALVWNETDLLRARIGLLEWGFPAGVLRERADEPEWGITAGICAQLHRLAASRGTRTVFLLLPERLQLDRGLLDSYATALKLDTTGVDLDQPNRLLGAALASEGLLVVDALPVLREAYAAGEQVYGTVDLHLGVGGHAVVARLLKPVMVRELRAAKGPRDPLATPAATGTRFPAPDLPDRPR